MGVYGGRAPKHGIVFASLMAKSVIHCIRAGGEGGCARRIYVLWSPGYVPVVLDGCAGNLGRDHVIFEWQQFKHIKSGRILYTGSMLRKMRGRRSWGRGDRAYLLERDLQCLFAMIKFPQIIPFALHPLPHPRRRAKQMTWHTLLPLMVMARVCLFNSDLGPVHGI